MEITVKTYATLCEIEIKSENSTIVEDLTHMGKCETDIDNELITAANEIARFKGIEDVDFVMNVFNHFLSDHEKDDFKERLNK